LIFGIHGEQVYSLALGNLIAVLGLIIKELSIKNFKSFYGDHVFGFSKGINVIIGGSGIGKTNFCNAIEFALFGAVGFTSNKYTSAKEQYSGLINKRRVEEADSERDWIGCDVKLLFEDENDEYMLDRSYSPFNDNDAREKVTYSTLAPKISSSEYREYVYVDEDPSRYSHEYRSESQGYVSYESLNNIVNKNVSKGFGLLLLDNSLSRFNRNYTEKALSLLDESALDQIILLMGTSQEVPTSLASKAICLGKTIETVIFKVHDFPFPPEGLLDDIDIMIYDRYVTEGEVFKRDVYRHEYAVEAVEVVPNGARYQRDVSKIIIQ
jgi:hypothetical protein